DCVAWTTASTATNAAEAPAARRKRRQSVARWAAESGGWSWAGRSIPEAWRRMPPTQVRAPKPVELRHERCPARGPPAQCLAVEPSVDLPEAGREAQSAAQARDHRRRGRH